MSVQEILDTWYGTPFVVVICVYVHSVSKMRKLEKTFDKLRYENSLFLTKSETLRWGFHFFLLDKRKTKEEGKLKNQVEQQNRWHGNTIQWKMKLLMSAT